VDFRSAQKLMFDLNLGSWHNPLVRGVRCNVTRSHSNMTIHAHIAELERKHRALDDEIAEALAHPSTDDTKIAELKRRKLLVKDEIQRMRIGETVSLH